MSLTNINLLDANGFPRGSFAYHPALQHCYILKAQGSKRVVRYQDTNSNNVKFKRKAIPVSELLGLL